jgi:hypothetical protein
LFENLEQWNPIHSNVVGGSATTSVETDAVDFFSRDAIPPLSLPRMLPLQIDMAFEHSRNPELPTVFD